MENLKQKEKDELIIQVLENLTKMCVNFNQDIKQLEADIEIIKKMMINK